MPHIISTSPPPYLALNTASQYMLHFSATIVNTILCLAVHEVLMRQTMTANAHVGWLVCLPRLSCSWTAAEIFYSHTPHAWKHKALR